MCLIHSRNVHRCIAAFNRVPLTACALFGACIIGAAALAAHGQADDRMIFVANNGNLEGSVTALKVNADGSLTFVDKLITGLDDDMGTNAQTISLTPSGRFLCTGHGTISLTDEQLTIIEVAPDGTMTQFAEFLTPDSPLDVQWLDDTHIAVTKTSVQVTNQVRVYEFDPNGPSLTTLDTENLGSFNTFLVYDAAHGFLYTPDTTGTTITTYAVNSDWTLSFQSVIGSGSLYAINPGLTPDGSALYAGGGISGGGDKILGYDINTSTGAMVAQSASPYTSPGASPKQVVVSQDGRFAYVSHGTDSTVRTFSIDASTGALTPTGFLFDIGFQGSAGDMTVDGELMFITDRDTILDGQRGVYSFSLGPNGELIQNGPLVDTQGISPWMIAAWSPPVSCPADLTGGKAGQPDGVVDVFDLFELLNNWGTSGAGAELAEPTDVVDVFDLFVLLNAWGPCE